MSTLSELRYDGAEARGVDGQDFFAGDPEYMFCTVDRSAAARRLGRNELKKLVTGAGFFVLWDWLRCIFLALEDVGDEIPRPDDSDSDVGHRVVLVEGLPCSISNSTSALSRLVS
jgi:hypothetical protein